MKKEKVDVIRWKEEVLSKLPPKIAKKRDKANCYTRRT